MAHSKAPSSIPSDDFPIVGIGASAGGITALQVLFKHVPAEPNLAFVVVQHMLPNQPSQLTGLIRRWTQLQVHDAADGVKIERNCIYVAQPGRCLLVQRGVFVTRPLEDQSSRAGIDTIDAFFESLAKDVAARAVAVVLSGTGTDGAAGAVRVRQSGGMVLVQDPTTAMHDGMPIAAIATGGADHILPLPALALELVACASASYVRSTSATTWASDVTRALHGIMALIQKKAGLDLTAYKRTPLLWRIQRRMELRRVPLFPDYESLLSDDPAELEALIRGIPIHVTEFFRDPDTWHALEREVIGPLFLDARDTPIRAWTPACASGEEAYSLAMLLAEQASKVRAGADFQVFATDVAAEMVARASRGIFKPAAINALSPERRQAFFYAADGAFRVKRALREKMVFASQDLLADPPLTDLDLITCRNLLIYLEPDAAKRVIYLLHSALRVGGYLLLGKGESLSPRQKGFEELASLVHIYRKTDRSTDADIEFPRRPSRLRPARSSRSAVEAHAHETAVEQHDLPAVLVDEHYQVLRLFGDTAPFLRFKPGPPTLHLPSLLTPLMAAGVENALQEALTQQRAVNLAGELDPCTEELTLSIRVTPLDTPESGGARLLVTFIRSATSAERGAAERSGSRPRDAMDWSEALRVSHEELESSREELQALNEELRASNDQLNIANEDLNRANARLQEKIAELELQSRVLSSGAVMTLFLDASLHVRWFTPAIVELFPLLPNDVGRRITDLVQRFDDERFFADIQTVMQRDEPREAEVRNVDGKWFLRRIRPYRPETDGASGVAITFTDISAGKRVEVALRESEDRRGMALAAAQMGTFVWHVREDRGEPDARMLALFGQPPDGHLNLRESLASMIHPDDAARYSAAIAQASRPDGTCELHEDIRVRCADGSWRWLAVTGRIAFDERGRPLRMAGAALDISDRKRAEATLRESEERQAFLLRFSDALRAQPDADAVATHAIQLLASELKLDRCYVVSFRLDDGEADVTHQLGRSDLPPLPAAFRLSDYPATLREMLERTMVVEDASLAVALSDVDRRNVERLGQHAFIAASLRRGEQRPVWALVAVSATPRRWSQAEVALVEEVTERTWAAMSRARVETALRESEARLRKVLEIETVGAVFFDLLGGIHGANDAFLEIIGFSRSELQAGALRYDRLTPPEWRWRDEQSQRELTRSGKSGPFEKEYFRKDGSRLWLLCACTMLDEHTAVELVIDITERKRADAALRESDDRYRNLFESIDQGFCTIELLFDAAGEPVDYRFLLANSAYERLTGLQNVIGRKLSEVRPSALEDGPRLYAEVARTGQSIHIERHAEDLERVYEIRAWRAGEPDQQRVGILLNDITERRRAEQALRESETRMQLAMRVTRMVTWEWLPREDRIQTSDSFASLYGLSALQSAADGFTLVLPEDKPAHVAKVQKVAREGGGYTSEFRIRRPDDGRIVWLEERGEAQLDAAGNVQRVIGISLDATERKRAEEALHRSRVWLNAQKEAFQAAMNGESLGASLGVLIRTAVEHADTERRCAFYIADASGEQLRHVVGMPDGYARSVDGFVISPDSLACGLAVASGRPLITADVCEDPRWRPWLWLAREYHYRGCWSFPLETATGKLVGSFAMYFKEPQEPTARDLELASAMTQAAAIIIAHHHQVEERNRLSRQLAMTPPVVQP